MELARHKVQKEKLWTERLPGLGTAVGGLGGGEPMWGTPTGGDS